MIGTVNKDGVPTIVLSIVSRNWTAVIDTGFNGDLELPETLRPFVNARFLCRSHSLLAGGQVIEEDTYLVDFPFDGRTIAAEATFVGTGDILVGTHLLKEYRLEVDFPAARVVVEKAES